MTDIFGDIKVTTQLEDAVLATLNLWWKTYSREVEIQTAIPEDSYPLPRSYIRADQMDREGADQLPSIVVVSPGMSGRNPPKQEGDGTFRCFFSIGIGVFVGADQRTSTMNLVRIYTAIARTIMLQKQSLGGYADGTSWLDESYDDNFPFTDGKTISAGQVIFEVELAQVVNRFGGPTAAPNPDTQPGSDWPLVETVTSTVSTPVVGG